MPAKEDLFLKTSQFFFTTLRETPAEAQLISHQLLLRGGFICRLAAGIYSFLPLGWRVLSKIADIVREEMDGAGGQELLLPNLHPEELWVRSGRSETWGPELMKLKDRNDRVFCLGATHEEVITDLVKGSVRSYRQMPLLLYQIQFKYRDEPRPRGGLIRCREFVMKDAYSFDRDQAGLNESYQSMREAYEKIFQRCGIHCQIVEASAGLMGGGGTEEFVLLSDAGEDVVLLCSSCGYAASLEQADFGLSDQSSDQSEGEEPAAMEPVETPGMKTIGQVTKFLEIPASRLVKTLIYLADDRPVAALVRGDRDLNEGKLQAVLEADSLEMASEGAIKQLTGAPVGFSGPVGLADVEIIADHELKSERSLVTGANRNDYHLLNVNWGRDFQIDRWERLRSAVAGDACPHCQGNLEGKRGIELGQIFKLDTVYSEPLGAKFVDEDGQERPIIMGCYGIGVSRIMGAVVEASHDEKGIIWPREIAPFQAIIILVNASDQAQSSLANQVYQELSGRGVEVLLDDREERPGVKFNDADLIGVPIQVVAGRSATEGRVEVRRRGGEQAELLTPDQAVERVQSWAQGEK